MAKSNKVETNLANVNLEIERFLKSIDTKIYQGKGLELTKLWMTLDIDLGLEKRYAVLGGILEVSSHSCRRYCQRLKWKELDSLLKKKYILSEKPKTLITKDNLDGTVIVNRENEEVALTAETAAAEATKQAENPAFSQLAANLRETTVLSLSLLKDSLIYAYKMSVFYTRQIELVIEAAGGMEHLTKDNALEIQEYEKKVNKYLEGVKYAINPNSIFNNLKMLGYSSDLLKANEDTRVMTPDHIQKMLLEMVQGEGMRNYTQKPFEAMIAETDYADVELPSIDGRANKNIETDARNKK